MPTLIPGNNKYELPTKSKQFNINIAITLKIFLLFWSLYFGWVVIGSVLIPQWHVLESHSLPDLYIESLEAHLN